MCSLLIVNIARVQHRVTAEQDSFVLQEFSQSWQYLYDTPTTYIDFTGPSDSLPNTPTRLAHLMMDIRKYAEARM